MADTITNLLEEIAAAKYIGLSVAFLRDGRSRGVRGARTPSPPFLKLGRSVRYDRRDLDAWLAARRVDPARPGGNAGAEQPLVLPAHSATRTGRSTRAVKGKHAAPRPTKIAARARPALRAGQARA